MPDLVNQLRELVAPWQGGHELPPNIQTMQDAADRILELESRLEAGAKFNKWANEHIATLEATLASYRELSHRHSDHIGALETQLDHARRQIADLCSAPPIVSDTSNFKEGQ